MNGLQRLPCSRGQLSLRNKEVPHSGSSRAPDVAVNESGAAITSVAKKCSSLIVMWWERDPLVTSGHLLKVPLLLGIKHLISVLIARSICNRSLRRTCFFPKRNVADTCDSRVNR